MDNRLFKIEFCISNKSLYEPECIIIPSQICGQTIRANSKKLNIQEAYENVGAMTMSSSKRILKQEFRDQIVMII